MISATNVGVIVGGLVADPEVVTTKNGKIYKFRLAADRAGQEGGKIESGYFDVIYFDNDDSHSSKFIRAQVESQNFHKGTQLHVLYRLNHERWKGDGGESRSKITLVAEAMNYAGSAQERDSEAKENKVSESPGVSLPSNW